LDNPLGEFGVRELGRQSGISPPSVLNYLKKFQKERLIIKSEKRGNPFYKADRDNEKFVLYKKMSILYELQKSGLIDFLWDKLSPSAIILYGSYAKGESIEGSDVDLFIIGKEKDTDISKFEDILGKEVHLMFMKDIKKIPDELKNNLINGIVMRGYFKAI